MAIEKDDEGVFTACCDECYTTVEIYAPEAESVGDAQYDLRLMGWKVPEDGTVRYGLSDRYNCKYFKHICPDCAR